ncbi:EF-hand domain-containing protein [Aporhodopirellula aestuarii]|uniref:EF-hand domain-containing protein n=1 Tax=Aporhodopirellula aestuarii TaxID=2950107 RepID=A0ABT0UB25_9BACT|nr:EF-hand domain-containing protein [Aporhodopirellula aestuarii]MCM2374209.1 EF-hand domain-containing protein [Aporhodopirellula aestuarii]
MNRRLQLIANFGIALSASLLSGTSYLLAQPPGRGGPPGMNQGGGPPTEMIIQLFTQADANGDGCVTKAELTAVLQYQGRANQYGRGGPPPQGGNGGPPNQQMNPPPQDGGQHGPPPQPGQILPEPVAESLNLSTKQTRQLAALQADVDKRLAAILTDEQEDQLENSHPPQHPDHGEEAGGRPQRPQ